jgi:ElaB/YqjD/DUF883 family membrane-anchored ribosome-binding protein
MAGKTLRAELDEMRAELAKLREAQAGPEAAAPPPSGGWSEQASEMNKLVHQMLEDAEETITDHPAATIAAALALGIVIGRLTAR